MNLTSLSVIELRTLLVKKEIKAEEAVLSHLEKIEEREKKISAFITVLAEEALDQIGPLTQTVEDCTLLTQIIAGPDFRDSTLSPLPVPDYPEEIREDLK